MHDRVRRHDGRQELYRHVHRGGGVDDVHDDIQQLDDDHQAAREAGEDDHDDGHDEHDEPTDVQSFGRPVQSRLGLLLRDVRREPEDCK
jgi:hypothetical protein